jgi:exoribonuclease-2
VPCYAWSTSPLRRYTDLVNQWQILACVRHGATAALVAPFKPKDAQLFGVISAFDAIYTAYNQFQNGLERYWTLRYVQQEDITEITATLIKDGLVRADTLPLVLPVMGADGMERGTALRIKLGAADLMTLEISGTVLERLDAQAHAQGADEDADEDLPATGVTLAIDLQDDPSETPAAEPSAS